MSHTDVVASSAFAAELRRLARRERWTSKTCAASPFIPTASARQG